MGRVKIVALSIFVLHLAGAPTAFATGDQCVPQEVSGVVVLSHEITPSPSLEGDNLIFKVVLKNTTASPKNLIVQFRVHEQGMGNQPIPAHNTPMMILAAGAEKPVSHAWQNAVAGKYVLALLLVATRDFCRMYPQPAEIPFEVNRADGCVQCPPVKHPNCDTVCKKLLMMKRVDPPWCREKKIPLEVCSKCAQVACRIVCNPY